MEQIPGFQLVPSYRTTGPVVLSPAMHQTSSSLWMGKFLWPVQQKRFSPAVFQTLFSWDIQVKMFCRIMGGRFLAGKFGAEKMWWKNLNQKKMWWKNWGRNKWVGNIGGIWDRTSERSKSWFFLSLPHWHTKEWLIDWNFKKTLNFPT